MALLTWRGRILMRAIKNERVVMKPSHALQGAGGLNDSPYAARERYGGPGVW